MKPRLKAAIIMPPSSDDALLSVRFGSAAFDVVLKEGDPLTFIKLLGLMNGANSIESISQDTGLELIALVELVRQFVQSDLVYDYDRASAPQHIAVADLLRAVSALMRAFRVDMFRHPLFTQLDSNDNLFLATAIEYGHIVRQAASHIAWARDHAPYSAKSLLSDYLESERNHYVPLELAIGEALSMHFRFDDVAPLPATDALLLKTHALAEHNTLAYIACCSAFEAEFLPEQMQPPGLSPGVQLVYKVLRKHAEEDVDSSHSTLLEQALNKSEVLESQALVEVCEAIHTYKHYFDNLNHELLRIHSFANVTPVRCKPRYWDFI